MSDMGRPTFSVVTATLNNARQLSRCIGSVANQGGIEAEHIVIDGGSGDSSAQILAEWSSHLAFWTSESDSGISEAMNKGARMATGRWLLFLHADDILATSNTLSNVQPILESTDADIVGFPIQYGNAPGRIIEPRGANSWLRLKTGLLHQATFIRREVFQRIGFYDERLKIAMDYEFFLRAWKARVLFATYGAPVVAHMGDEGISSKLDWPSLSRRLMEERKIQTSHVDHRWQLFAYELYWLAYIPYKRIMAANFRNSKLPREGE